GLGDSLPPTTRLRDGPRRARESSGSDCPRTDELVNMHGVRRFVSLVLVLGACGDKSDPQPDAPPPTDYVAAATGFMGTPCFDGIRYSTPQLSLPYVLVCTEKNGLFKTTLDSPLTWTNVDMGGITNPNGRVVATNPNGPPVMFISDASTANNAFRSST